MPLPMPTADESLTLAAQRWPDAPALWRDGAPTTYRELAARVDRAAGWLAGVCPLRGSRIAVWLDKRVDTVVALFAAMRAGHVALPLNPALRAAQALAALRDARATLLLTDAGRRLALRDAQEQHPLWRCVDVEGAEWQEALSREARHAPPHRDAEELAIVFYTSGSSGPPKGVMVTHANLLAGAAAVNAYLGHRPDDRLLAALPLSFDAGFSQLTTAFAAGASVVLLDHLFPADLLAALERYRVTGITAVPPLYLQLLKTLDHTVAAGKTGVAGAETLRYFANTGGHLPAEAWQALRAVWPRAEPHSMYGLTEAFRASRLPPGDFERKPGSVGVALPGGTRLHLLRPDGRPCAAGEPGQLVQQGPLVARGYWNDPQRSAQCFRPGPDGAPAVWSGDTLRQDEEGYLWFIGRDDGQIKTSGYRVSPSEVEAAAAAAGWAECVALGVPDALLGEVLALVVADGDSAGLAAALHAALPAWMRPRHIEVWPGALPRTANGKFDRMLIRQQLLARLAAAPCR